MTLLSRTLWLTMFLAFSTLSSCTTDAPVSLPPSVVLEKAILRNALREKPQVTGVLDFSISGSLSGSIVFTGSLLKATNTNVVEATYALVRTNERGHVRASGKIALVVLNDRQPLLSFTDGYGLLFEEFKKSAQSSLSGWYSLSTKSGSLALPESGFLSAQTLLSSIAVHEDRGMLKKNGEYYYSYIVGLSSTEESSPMVTGDLEINARSFDIERAVWNIHSRPRGHLPWQARITLSFRDSRLLEIPFLPSEDIPELQLLSIFDTILQKR